MAAFYFAPGVEQRLAESGFEAITIDYDTAGDLLEKEIDNPALYRRKSNVSGPLRLKFEEGNYIYTDDQKEIVLSLMEELKKGIEGNPDSFPGFKLEDLDLRKNDQYRLLLIPEKYPQDRLLTYNRARKGNEIHFMYVPDFSFTTQKSTQRKIQFRRFINNQKERIEELFGLELFSNTKKLAEVHLVITAQAWKGFSQIYNRF